MRIATGIAALAALSIQSIAFAQTADPTSADLDQRLKVIERKLENPSEESQNKAKDGGTASASDKGFGFRSADGSFELKFHANVQLDGRFFVDDPLAQAYTDTFTFRRIEPSLEATLGKLGYVKIQPQFAGDTASTADVFGELRFATPFVVRAGKFKEPISLENLQPATALEFNERGFPTELAPSRDLGVQFQGDLLNGTTSYAIGLFNGTADGRDSVASDTDNRKEGAARVWVEPFRNDSGFFHGLGFGLAGSTGTKLSAVKGNLTNDTAAFNNVLPRYRSPGQATIFSYKIVTTGAPTAADTAIANGRHTRYSPQLYFYRNSVGLLGEYIASRQDVGFGGVTQTFTHKAYQGVASWVVTGEDAGYKGVRPGNPYAVGGDGCGALELVARYGVLDTDDDAFTSGFADPANSVSRARDAGAGVNWILTANLRLSADFDLTRFDGGAAAGANRPIERALFTRFQYSF